MHESTPIWGKWYSAKQAAEILRISIDAVYYWARKGPLNAHRFDRQLFFSEDEIQRVAAERYAAWLRQTRNALDTGRETPIPIIPPSIKHMGDFAQPHWKDTDSESAAASRQDRGAHWIRPESAAQILGITVSALHFLGRRGKITRRAAQPTSRRTRHRERWQYNRVELENLAEKRSERNEQRRDPRHSLKHWGDRRRIPDWLPVDHWINTREAANILKCTPENIAHLVRTGVLPGFQKRPGKQGSPLRLVQMHVVNYAARESYQARRKRWEKGFERGYSRQCSPLCKRPNACAMTTQPGEEPPCRPRYTEGWDEHDLQPIKERPDRRVTERDHGDFYTTRQTAFHLGVSVGRVYVLRLTGALKGYQRPARTDKIDMYTREPRTGTRWWFFKKDDVHELKFNPDHEKRHNAWLKSSTDEAKQQRENARFHAVVKAIAEAREAFEKQHGPNPFHIPEPW